MDLQIIAGRHYRVQMEHLRHGCVGPRRGSDAFGLLERQLWPAVRVQQHEPSLPAGQAGWAPAAQRRRGTPARTAGSGGSAHSRIGATLMRPNRIGLPRQAVAGAGGHPRSLLAVAGDGVGMRGHQPRGPLRVTALEPEYARDKPSRPADKDQLRRTHLCPTPGKEQDHDRTSTLRLVHRR
jgi:hypothetical protein